MVVAMYLLSKSRFQRSHVAAAAAAAAAAAVLGSSRGGPVTLGEL